MSRSRSLLGGLVTTAAAGLTLAGCGAGSSAGSVSATASTGASGTATATASAAGSGSGSLTISGDSSYFPDTVGDTWVYQTQTSAGKSTATNKVTGVTSIASGTQVTLTDTNDVSGTTQSSSLQYIIHSDGSVGIPINLGSAADTVDFKVKSGGLAWPSPSQLASGQPVDDTIVMSFSEAGTTYSVTDHAVVKGEGTQSVTVPAGTYQATLIDDVETESILGTPTTFDIKTWVVNGIGPIKDTMTTGTAGDSDATTEVLQSFTKG
jgi:hypothetical protein